jgi:hypothetical protein
MNYLQEDLAGRTVVTRGARGETDPEPWASHLFFVLRGAGARRDGIGVTTDGYWLWGGADAPLTTISSYQIGRVATAEEVAEAERTYHIPADAVRTRYIDYLRRLAASGADEAGRARDALATLES